MGIRRVASSSPCLILAMRVERSLLKSASGARKFISILDGSLGLCVLVSCRVTACVILTVDTSELSSRLSAEDTLPTSIKEKETHCTTFPERAAVRRLLPARFRSLA
eukprot:1158888-Pelagomonas_calceolata.AAC.5